MTTMQTGFREEESALYEILHPLVIRWKLIAGGVLTGIILAGVVSSFLPKQYETSLLLNIGLAVEKILEDPYTVAKVINSEAFQQTIAGKVGLNVSSKRLSKMIEAETDSIRVSPWVSVRIRANSPQETVRLANAIADGIILRHSKSFEEKMKGYKDYKNELQESIAQFTEEAQTLRKNLDAYRSGTKPDVSTEILLQTRLSEKENQAIMFKRELRDISSYMAKVHSRETSVVAAPMLPEAPVSPKMKLNLLIAAVTSLFIMISFVLFREQYRKSSLGI
ncbi:hypothetical protein L0222_25635 [bacterium]|nr:hypothetical protein [bacterium]